MKKILNVSLVLAAFVASMIVARAADSTAPAATANEVTHSIVLPSPLKVDDIAAGVAKAFTALTWTSVSVEKGVVSATLYHHDIIVHAKATATESEVKIVATFEPGPVKQDKARSSVERWLRNVDKNSKEELGILPKPEKKEKKQAS